MNTDHRRYVANSICNAAMARRTMLLICFIALIPALASAQTTKERRTWGYGFIAPSGRVGVSDFGLHFGGGGEGLIKKGVGVGAEIGYIGPARDLGRGFGVFSLNGSYHFVKPNSDQKLVPFITGGYTLAFAFVERSVNGGNIGGGVQYWASEHVGLRFEVRHHIMSSAAPSFYGFRAGVSFR